ncbi:MAG: hypothetical protein FWC48_00585 [Actinomycetia bacterium]|nr:hypothetical protein [Actinomycetes bacterium]
MAFVLAGLLVTSLLVIRPVTAESAPAIGAPNITVSDETELRAAIAGAPLSTQYVIAINGTIELGARLDMPANKDIALCGGGVLSAAGNYTTIYVSGSTTLEAVTITHDPGTIGMGIQVMGTLVILDGAKISGNVGGVGSESINGGAVRNDGTIVMWGGEISGNRANGNTNTGLGGGVFNTPMSKGSFTMNGGSITGNTGINGGGVYNNGSLFTMNGGTISNNKAGNGGGVVTTGGALFTLNDGTISGNTASGGGGIYSEGGPITINGGEISGNNGGTYGGGIYDFKYSTYNGPITISGGTISDNTAAGGAGIACQVPLTMSGGTIARNKSTGGSGYGGGGVYIMQGTSAAPTTFTMTAGSISDNSSTSVGGGIFAASQTTVSTTGNIMGNKASSNGGGVYVSSGTYAMGGTIANNVAGLYGGGVYTAQAGYTNLSVLSGQSVCFTGNIAQYKINPPAGNSLRTNVIDPSATGFSTSFGTAFTNFDINVVAYKIALNTYGNGTAVADNDYALPGTVVTLTARPAELAKFMYWYLYSGNATLGDTTAATTSFVMPAAAVNIYAYFFDTPQLTTRWVDDASGDDLLTPGTQIFDQGAFYSTEAPSTITTGTPAVTYDLVGWDASGAPQSGYIYGSQTVVYRYAPRTLTVTTTYMCQCSEIQLPTIIGSISGKSYTTSAPSTITTGTPAVTYVLVGHDLASAPVSGTLTTDSVTVGYLYMQADEPPAPTPDPQPTPDPKPKPGQQPKSDPRPKAVPQAKLAPVKEQTTPGKGLPRTGDRAYPLSFLALTGLGTLVALLWLAGWRRRRRTA